DARHRLVLGADHPDATLAEPDPRGSPDWDLTDDPIRIGVDDADRVRWEGGEARTSVTRQLDDCDRRRRCEDDERTCRDQHPCFSACPFARGPRRRLDDLIVGEDRPLQLLESRAWLETELFRERTTCVSVDRECFRL